MAKGFARLGIFLTLLFVNQGVRAVAVGELPTGEITVNPALADDSHEKRLETFIPAVEPVDLLDISIGDDQKNRQRIETDLLILPGRFSKLAGSGSKSRRKGRVVREYTSRETSVAVQPRAFDLPAVC